MVDGVHAIDITGFRPDFLNFCCEGVRYVNEFCQIVFITVTLKDINPTEFVQFVIEKSFHFP